MPKAASVKKTKVCSRCQKRKPTAEFYQLRTGKPFCQCKPCHRLSVQESRARRKAKAARPTPEDAADPKEQKPQELTRTCRRCGVEQPIVEFYLDRLYGWRRHTCRRCCRVRARARYEELREHYRVTGPARRKREDPEQARARRRRARARQDRRKVRARTISRRLRELGVLHVSDTCLDCGRPSALLHHKDYGNVTDVLSLCRSCHMKRHMAEWRRTGGGPVKYPWEYEERITTEAPRSAEGHREEGP